MTDKLMVPMIVLARHLKNAAQVPAVNPNYKTALISYLGKDSTPDAFNTNILLDKGVHLHFVLPSAFKKGYEETNENGETVLNYPAVPDRFLVTRMYVTNNKIKTDCHIVESNFYSLDSAYCDSITIPKFDDLRARHRYRYMGRAYAAAQPVPEPIGECGYFDKITALGAGDPMFSAYYPSCHSVFGFYDNLEGVPSNAVLSYFVIGYYSNSEYDMFHNVKNMDDMEAVLEKYNLSVADGNKTVCNSCLLFGEVGGIDLSAEDPVPVGNIDIGIGKSSAEALSAIITGRYYKDRSYNDCSDKERFLNSIQYDTADEARQPDGNFKIDDDIHAHGFSRMDPLENTYALRFPKDVKQSEFEGLAKQYSELLIAEHNIGRLRRRLEYQKNSLYYLWELYEAAGSKKKEEYKGYMAPVLEEISRLRNDIYDSITANEKNRQVFIQNLKAKNSELEITSCEPFYLPADPAVMLFGEGMNRTYAFGEDGRFEADNTLYCLTAPLASDISEDKLLAYFENLPDLSGICEDYKDCAVSALLLDTVNVLPKLKLQPDIKEKFSPILFNDNPKEQVTLLLQWRSVFYPDYTGSDPEDSSFEYGNTDYVYDGPMSDKAVYQEGFSVLTPHGLYNLQDKLKKYIDRHADDPDASKIADIIKDLPAVSQSLGGFHLCNSALEYAFQFPIDIDPKDDYSKMIAQSLTLENPQFYEPAPERQAVRENSAIFPLREGFFGLYKLSMVSSFGEQRKIIDDELTFKKKKYVSENLQPEKDGFCFFPLALSSPARLFANFVMADDNKSLSSPLPGATPVICIFQPDMLNRNLNIFSNTGKSIGVLKTAYRNINGKKIPVGRFVPSPDAPADIDSRIKDFIAALTQDNTAFAEVMSVIDEKLNVSLPLSQNNFIFGRTLVLAEIAVELEFFGAPEWSKKDDDIGKFDDLGISEQKIPILFGDRNRVTDGVCCGFCNGFAKGFAAFGSEHKDAGYLNAEPFSVKQTDGIKNVTLLFDPMLKVTVNTGILPVKQLEIYGEHTDFSQFQLLSSEFNTVISDEKQADLPAFMGEADFSRFYPKLNGGDVEYEKLNIAKYPVSIGEIGKMIITDGFLVERSDKSGV